MSEENHAVSNAIGHWNSIKQLISRLEDAVQNDDQSDEPVRDDIYARALCVDVRSDWYNPCGLGEQREELAKPIEYRILLTTGGPALQLTGLLSEYGEPETAELEHQDWGIPWTRSFPYIHTKDGVEWDAYQETLLAFARCFYFGE